jgi:hypothetical protein
MSLEDLGNIGEFVAAVGVIVSLIYLAVQIRQNTQQVNVNTTAVQQASFDQAIQCFSRFRGPMTQDQAVAELYLTGLRDPDALNAGERLRFRHLLMDLFLGYYSLFLRVGDSVISREAWEANIPMVRTLLCYPGVATWWEALHDTCGYHPSFVAEIDAIRASIADNAPPITDHYLQGERSEAT